MRLASSANRRENQRMLKIPLSMKAFAVLALATFGFNARAEIAVKSGEKIAFLGDSITQAGWSMPDGYVKLIIAGLAANGITGEPVPAGISGHKSNQMLARLEKDVLSKKPQWMTLSCGVNDVWHGMNGVPLDDESAAANPVNPPKPGEPEKGTYKRNISAIVDQAMAAGVKVVLLTATVIQEKLDNAENAKLAAYNDFLRALAKEKKLPLADLNAMFQERLKTTNMPEAKVLTTDGVHMNADGNRLMAVGVLRAFGLGDAELQKAQEAWASVRTN
jgi:lysophospholipase L1-like esterase